MPVSDVKSLPQLLADDRHVFGILTVPDGAASEVGIIILNAGLLHNVGPFRMHVDLSNALAVAGAKVIRIDQSGKGESPSRSSASRMDALLKDYEDARATLGVERTVLLGLCSGADDALQIADQRASVAGVVLLDGYAKQNSRFHWNRFVKRVKRNKNLLAAIGRRLNRRKLNGRGSGDAMEIDIRDWKSDSEMTGLISRLLNSDRRILAVFTSGQDYYNYHGQLRDLLTGNLENLKEIFYEGVDHTYSRVEHRQALVDAISRWFNQEFGRRAKSR